MTLSIKNIIRIRVAAKTLQLLNGISTVVSAIGLYGLIGESDYTAFYHISMTAAEEHALWIKTLLCFLIMTISMIMCGMLVRAIEWLDYCIKYRREKERQRRDRAAYLAQKAEYDRICQERRAGLNLNYYYYC